MEPSTVDSLLIFIGFLAGMFAMLLPYTEIRARARTEGYKRGHARGLLDGYRNCEKRVTLLEGRITQHRNQAHQRSISAMDNTAQLDGYQNTIDRLRQTIAKAYGWLWHENGSNAVGCCHKARSILLQKLDKDLQAYGISAALKEGAEPMEGVIFTDATAKQPALEQRA